MLKDLKDEPFKHQGETPSLPIFFLLLLKTWASFHWCVCLHCGYPSCANGECVCVRSDTPKEEVGRVTEETQFVFSVWMSYYPFLLFSQGTALWWIMVPQLSAVVNVFTLDLGSDDSKDERGEKTLPQPTVVQSTSKLFALTVITTLPARPGEPCEGLTHGWHTL